MHKYMILVMAILAPTLGIPGNGIIIAIFGRRQSKNVTDVAIIAMALVDMVVSGFSIVKLLNYFYGVSDITCKIRGISSRIGLFTSVFLTVMIAVYRYKAICKPFSHQWSLKSSVVVSAVCLFFAAAINAPIVYLGHAFYLGPRLLICDLYGDSQLVARIYSSGQTALFTICSTTVTVIYVKIFLVIRSSQKARKALLGGTRGTGTDVQVISQEQFSSRVSGIDTSVSMVVVDSKCNDRKDTDAQKNDIIMTGNEGQPKYLTNPAFEPDEKTDQSESLSNRASSKGQDLPSDSRKKGSTKREKTKSQSPANKGEHRVTVMLVVIAAVLFISWFPTVVYEYLTPMQLIKMHEQKIWGPIWFLLIQLKYINNFTNVFIYAAINRKFRKECYDFITCKFTI